MADSWLSVPEGTILALKRRWTTGEPDQWAVTADVNGLTVRRSRPDNGKSWHDTQAEERFIDLNDVLKRIPDLRTLRRGTISEYTVDSMVLEPPVFVSLLEIPPGEGPETAGQWPAEVADEWRQRFRTPGLADQHGLGPALGPGQRPPYLRHRHGDPPAGAGR